MKTLVLYLILTELVYCEIYVSKYFKPCGPHYHRIPENTVYNLRCVTCIEAYEFMRFQMLGDLESKSFTWMFQSWDNEIDPDGREGESFQEASSINSNDFIENRNEEQIFFSGNTLRIISFKASSSGIYVCAKRFQFNYQIISIHHVGLMHLDRFEPWHMTNLYLDTKAKYSCRSELALSSMLFTEKIQNNIFVQWQKVTETREEFLKFPFFVEGENITRIHNHRLGTGKSKFISSYIKKSGYTGVSPDLEGFQTILKSISLKNLRQLSKDLRLEQDLYFEKASLNDSGMYACFMFIKYRQNNSWNRYLLKIKIIKFHEDPKHWYRSLFPDEIWRRTILYGFTVGTAVIILSISIAIMVTTAKRKNLPSKWTVQQPVESRYLYLEKYKRKILNFDTVNFVDDDSTWKNSSLQSSTT